MKSTILFIFLAICSFNPKAQVNMYCNDNVKVGASFIKKYLPIIKNKRVAIVANQSSLVYNSHLVDTLISLNVNVVKVFSPEHGFRGKADAGEKVKSGIDSKTGLQIISLYGNNKKPKASQLQNVDVVLFDIQDVGARFYTYLSTLHYVMEACAENNIKVIILDRPNPNGHYVDGPVLKDGYSSFVGMHKVPIVHGMTIGEYGTMINNEGWLINKKSCNLEVIKCEGWDHTKFYKLPVKPSPNLPNMMSIYLYPSLCLFEGTVVSVGRGTSTPFQIIGHPSFNVDSFSFIPKPSEGAKHPKLEDETCYGIDFNTVGVNVIQKQNQIHLNWIIQFYKTLDLKDDFFLKNNFINLLAGSNELKQQIKSGLTEEQIRLTWQTDIDAFKKIRKKYLLYKDFE